MFSNELFWDTFKLQLFKLVTNHHFLFFNSRKSCLNCTCDRNNHEMQEDDIVTSYKMNRLSIHDSNDNILIDEQSNDEYLWVPPGLDRALVCEKFLLVFGSTKTANSSFSFQLLLSRWSVKDFSYSSGVFKILTELPNIRRYNILTCYTRLVENSNFLQFCGGVE